MSEIAIFNLRDGKYINDHILEHFIYLFNKEECKKMRKDKDYCTALMVDSHFLSELTAEGAYRDNQRPENPHKVFGRFGFKIRDPLQNGATHAGRDIFSNVARIFFIYNIPQYHWATFEVDPTTLNQQYFDSLWDTIESNPDHVKTSKAIHQWMLNYHEATMGHKHPKARRWTKGIVTDDHNVLRNAHQVGVDCGLHACVVPVLIQNGIPLQVLGQAVENISKELRVRMTLLMARNQFMFSPNITKVRKGWKAPVVSDETGSKLQMIQELSSSM